MPATETLVAAFDFIKRVPTGWSIILECSRASALLLMAIAATWPHQASALEGSYPTRTIKIIVPLVPGAAADVLPRLVAEKLAGRFGKPVVVENRPGANSNLGAELVANAAPDGYTLLATPPSPLVINASLYSKLSYDPQAFVPITVLATLPNILVARPNAPYHSLNEMLAFAKTHEATLNYGSPGVGSSPSLAMEWLNHLAGIQMMHVPYNGIPPILKDVMAGQIDLTFANAFTVLGLLQDGKLQALGIDSENRIPQLPDTPAINESFPGYVVTSWFALVAPPKTSSDVAAKLSAAIADILRQPDVTLKLRQLAATPIASSPERTGTFLKAESKRWHTIIAAAGLKAD